MKDSVNLTRILLLGCLMILTAVATGEAQRMRGGGMRGGGGMRPAATRSPGGNAHSINGGAQRSPQRTIQRQPGNSRDMRSADLGNSGRPSVGNRTNAGNKVNVDKSRRNVNVNIDNSRDVNIRNNRSTVVVRNPVPYRRPPYVYGGMRFYAYHPYYYHPFHPYYWGPVWHPWGFFIATLTATAIVLTVENQSYHYDQGVYYVESDGGYTVVQAPVGATIKVLPEGSEKVTVNETTNNYYYGGTYYEKSDGGYTVVPPTSGTVVDNLPEGAEEVKVGDNTYVKYGETYYQPVQVDGKNKYEVVDAQEGQ